MLQNEIKYNDCSKFPSHSEINIDFKDISWYKYLEEVYNNKNLRNINKESLLINKNNVELIYRNTKVHTRIYTADNKSMDHYSKYNPPTNFAKYNTIFIPRIKELIPFPHYSWVEVIRYKVGIYGHHLLVKVILPYLKKFFLQIRMRMYLMDAGSFLEKDQECLLILVNL